MSDPRLADGSFPVTIGNNEFLMSMLTDKDEADLTGYIQAKYIEIARNIDKELQDDDGEILKFALATAVKVTWMTRAGMEIINTNDGALRLGWQMMRKRHPGLSFKDFKDIIGKDNIDEMISKIGTAYSHLHSLNGKENGRESGSKSDNND